jgi:drug/metabolite transporter, DME family
VTLRIGLRDGSVDPEAASLSTSFVALAVAAVIAFVSLAWQHGATLANLSPFLVTGVLAPGLAQLFFVRAVREVGASRASVVVGTGPLVAVAIALAALGEPARPVLLFAAGLVVAGSLTLGFEPERPPEFRSVGIVFALLCTVLFATRDDLLRWLARGSSAPPLPAAAVATAGGAATILVVLLATRRVSRGSLRGAGRRFLLPGVLFGISYAFLFEAYYRGRVTVVSPLVATESLFGVLFAVLLLRRSEAVGRHVVIGALLVVAGAALIGGTR